MDSPIIRGSEVEIKLRAARAEKWAAICKAENARIDRMEAEQREADRNARARHVQYMFRHGECV